MSFWRLLRGWRSLLLCVYASLAYVRIRGPFLSDRREYRTASQSPDDVVVRLLAAGPSWVLVFH